MLQRLFELKLPVAAVLSKNKQTASLNLRDHQWELAEQIIPLLHPFEVVTRKLSDKFCCISDTIPFIHVLQTTLETDIASSEYLIDMRKIMLKG